MAPPIDAMHACMDTLLFGTYTSLTCPQSGTQPLGLKEGKRKLLDTMGDSVDMKGLVKHIVDGTFEQSLCRVCLLPLGEVCESVFTKICTEDQEFCVADVLKTVCKMQFSDTERCSVCPNCFIMASTTYKFLVLTKRSSEILDFYLKELENNVNSIFIPKDNISDSLCITLPKYQPTVDNCNFSIECCLTEEYLAEFEDEQDHKVETDTKMNNPKLSQPVDINKIKTDEELIVIVRENGEKSYYKLNNEIAKPPSKTAPRRRKRGGMIYRQCSQCPIKYRSLAKLTFHMKSDHNIDIFQCKVCSEVIEGQKEFDEHISSHTDVYQCDHCNNVFKKYTTLVSHMKWHQQVDQLNNPDKAHICELCGDILPTEEFLKQHYDKKHDKKYTCHYCGKMYRGERSCEIHVEKHEKIISQKEKLKKKDQPKTKSNKQLKTEESSSEKKIGPICATCGKKFVDERSLMWHVMLHNNERPYRCDVCGRGFISLNRRNQHVLCSHSLPSKRCPLCPALFHLRSMVNTHIKKVHLKAHKRRNHKSKHQNVHWKTETVPIQDLSVDIQNVILEMKTNPTVGRLDKSDPQNLPSETDFSDRMFAVVENFDAFDDNECSDELDS